MLKEIGSNFWDYNINDTGKNIFFPNVESNNSYYFVSGRMAIYALIKSLNISKGNVLLPSFTCETVIEPFQKINYEINYYDIKKDLTIDIEDLKNKIESNKTNIILFHNYFGFNTCESINSILDYVKKKNIIIIEDLTQSYYSSFKRIACDYYVSSLRKFIATPCGGILLTSKNKIEIEYSNNSEKNWKIDNVAIEAFDLKKKYIYNDMDELKNEYLCKYIELKNQINDFDEIVSFSNDTKSILSNVDVGLLMEKRRNNYKILLDNLKGIENIEIIFENIDNEIIPLYFPIYIKKERHAFQKYMSENQIFCPIIWPKSDYLKEYNNKIVDYIYESIICIPCDQRYGKEEMEYIVKKIYEYFQ